MSDDPLSRRRAPLWLKEAAADAGLTIGQYLRRVMPDRPVCVCDCCADRDPQWDDVPGLLAEHRVVVDERDAAWAERDAAVADLAALRSRLSDLTGRLGFGDDRTEPMADNDTIVRHYDEVTTDAREWWESQRWRYECRDAGHPDDQDCWEHDPMLRETALRTSVETLAVEWERVGQNVVMTATARNMHSRHAADLRRALTGEGPAGAGTEPDTAEPVHAPDAEGFECVACGDCWPCLRARGAAEGPQPDPPRHDGIRNWWEQPSPRPPTTENGDPRAT